MNNVDALRISQQRDDIYDSIVAQFRVLMEDDNIDGALALADEFFEWMDPDQLENESTLFYNEHELAALYKQLTK